MQFQGLNIKQLITGQIKRSSVAEYIIGDIHGCFKTFKALLSEINYNKKNDKLFLVGDLINRGPDSLSVLEYVYDNQDSCEFVLGNHELKIMESWIEGKLIDPADTFTDILDHKNLEAYIKWLFESKLSIVKDDFIIVHAGIYPDWTENVLIEKTKKVENELKLNSEKFIKKFFKLPLEKSIALKSKGADELQMALFYLTFMRVVDLANTAIFKLKVGLDDIPKGLYPWFRAPKKIEIDKHIFFGHWSDLGFFTNKNVTCLDSGCVKGNKLTAYNLNEKKIIQVKIQDSL